MDYTSTTFLIVRLCRIPFAVVNSSPGTYLLSLFSFLVAYENYLLEKGSRESGPKSMNYKLIMVCSCGVNGLL